MRFVYSRYACQTVVDLDVLTSKSLPMASAKVSNSQSAPLALYWSCCLFNHIGLPLVLSLLRFPSTIPILCCANVVGLNTFRVLILSQFVLRHPFSHKFTEVFTLHSFSPPITFYFRTSSEPRRSATQICFTFAKHASSTHLQKTMY